MLQCPSLVSPLPAPLRGRTTLKVPPTFLQLSWHQGARAFFRLTGGQAALWRMWGPPIVLQAFLHLRSAIDRNYDPLLAFNQPMGPFCTLWKVSTTSDKSKKFFFPGTSAIGRELAPFALLPREFRNLLATTVSKSINNEYSFIKQ